MPLLLDTQVIIWLEKNDPQLSKKALENIFTEPVLFLSKVSVWEMAIKFKTDKLVLKQPLELFIKNFLIAYKCKIMDINLSHIYQTQQLPLHHRDPFDRLLIAQSAIEQIAIVSADKLFDQYEIERVW